MRILWFSNSAGAANDYLNVKVLGGGWVNALEASLKEKVSLNVAFYYPRYSEKFEYKGINYYPICKKGWKLEMLKSLFFESFTDRKDINVYKEIIEDAKPDLIHIHGTENPFGCMIGSVDIPVVVSIQGNVTVCHHKFFSGIDRSYLFKTYFICCSIRDIPFIKSFRRSYKKFTWLRDLEIRNLQRCRYLIGRTDWDYRITRILAPNSIYFHGDEILRDSFYLSEWRPKFKEKLVIHTTNGNSPYKGFETICQALSLLINNGIDVEWRVAGIRNSDLIVRIVKDKLGKKYPKSGLILLGGHEEGQLVQKLLEADLYVMPSHLENSPNNLCEAMLLGMPCIATYAGGTGSLLKDGEDGILIQDGDPWALAGAIVHLKSNPERAIEMGMKARSKAQKRHHKQKVAALYLDIYSDIINSQR